ncbi:MAG: sarcinarray family MAST domain-containing protein [Methanolobus sp.]|jgi:sarcinarray family protein|nr:sarcinarray family MAST domain-containing protein [Methanolobus sp.]
MNKKIVLVGLIFYFAFIPLVSSAASQYISVDVYYNNQLYPGNSTPKPIVKIGEPFTLRFDVTVNQECMVYAKLSDLGTYQGINSFSLIEGTYEFGEYHEKVYQANETFSYEWTLKPTEEWAGGSMPIDFHYGILLKGEYEPTLNSEFTAAYVTISEEYYDGPEIQLNYSEDGQSNSPTTPAFTALVTVFALAVASVYRRM